MLFDEDVPTKVVDIRRCEPMPLKGNHDYPAVPLGMSPPQSEDVLREGILAAISTPMLENNLKKGADSTDVSPLAASPSSFFMNDLQTTNSTSLQLKHILQQVNQSSELNLSHSPSTLLPIIAASTPPTFTSLIATTPTTTTITQSSSPVNIISKSAATTAPRISPNAHVHPSPPPRPHARGASKPTTSTGSTHSSPSSVEAQFSFEEDDGDFQHLNAPRSTHNQSKSRSKSNEFPFEDDPDLFKVET